MPWEGTTRGMRNKGENYEQETLDDFLASIGRPSGKQGRELDQLHHSHVSDSGVHSARPDNLAMEEAVPGALTESYAIPAISFHYNRALILTAVLGLLVVLAAWKGVVSWHGFARVRWQLLAVAAPVAAFKAYGWVLSAFDRPVRVSAAEQAQLDRLRVVVTVPAYNEDRTILDRCIWALINQSRKPQRVDVVDDGSTEEDYSDLRAYWAGEHQGVEVTWERQPNAGKRRAHCLTFKSDKLADIFVTVDSDTALVHNALEEGLKPFTDPAVQSVAGIELGYNAGYNFITQIQNALQQLAQVVIGAAWSVTGDMYTNRGPFALYDADMVRELVPLYWGETIFGRQVVLGDDSLLALAGSMRGRSVQQLSAFGLTMWPETVDHHIRQRVRWARGRAVRNFWRVKYYPLRSYLFWYSVMGIYGFVSGLEVAYEMANGWPQDKRTVGAALLLMAIWSWLSQMRALCIKRDGDTWLDQAIMVFIRPVASLWSAVMLNRLVRSWGSLTLLKQKWTTRQKGAELHTDTPGSVLLQPRMEG
jgi:hyaluronan synthase